ncbi:alpha/beta hydrolase-fold protein [uncultured Dokdonia sp.]|uniref:alpha/beta hydrolase n=1 Tax=uncultured Dokdonia sp. TaxID=575653 RepID=UPI00262FDA48|nr:alpha/beta hydrolase-fold protein [uncultured Dokdonia sp.]
MKKIYGFLFLFLSLYTFSIAQQNETIATLKTVPFTIGETRTFYSSELEENRTINVYLPLSYDKKKEASYPVIYLLDGSKDEDFIHIAGIVQFGNFPWIDMLPESIVIGISNVDRKRDFTYPTTNTKDKEDFPTTGGSAAFISFLEKELQSYVANTYRVTEERTLIGQSLGGLLATEILWKQPTLFSNYIIVSPSLWWDDNSLLPKERAPITSPTKVYVAVGKEGPYMESAAFSLIGALKEDRQITSSFTYFNGQDHSNILHKAVYEAFVNFYTVEEEDGKE